jgi:hypothetical protein
MVVVVGQSFASVPMLFAKPMYYAHFSDSAGSAPGDKVRISGFDVGQIKSLEIDGDRVRIEFTPTFMGCPALETMRRQLEEAVVALGGEPQVDVLLDAEAEPDAVAKFTFASAKQWRDHIKQRHGRPSNTP